MRTAGLDSPALATTDGRQSCPLSPVPADTLTTAVCVHTLMHGTDDRRDWCPVSTHPIGVATVVPRDAAVGSHSIRPVHDVVVGWLSEQTGSDDATGRGDD